MYSYEKGVHLPNKDTLSSTTSGFLPLNEVSPMVKQAYVLPSLTDTSVLSIGQLCNDNCIAIFTKKDILIIKKGQIILTEKRNFNDGLLDILGHKLTQQLQNTA